MSIQAAPTRSGFAWLLPSPIVYGRYAVIIGGMLLMVVPILWVVFGSVKSDTGIIRSLSLIPSEVRWDNYVTGWTGSGISFGVYLLNSMVLCILAVVANLFACSLAGYASARLNFPFKPQLFAIMLLTIVVPRHISIIPEYVIFQRLGLIDTFVPMILPKLLGLDGFFIFLMTQFIKSLPVELEAAAEVDGCSRLQIFLLIVLPIMRPALVIVALLTFIFTYQNFMSQLIFLNSPRNFTVPLGLQSFIDQTSSSALGPTFAMSVVSLVPVVAMFLVFQSRSSTAPRPRVSRADAAHGANNSK